MDSGRYNEAVHFNPTVDWGGSDSTSGLNLQSPGTVKHSEKTALKHSDERKRVQMIVLAMECSAAK